MPLADPIRSLAGHTGRVSAVVFLKSGQLASASVDATIRLWDIAAGEEKQVLSGHAGPVMALAANGEGNLLASAGKDPVIKVWQIGSADPPKNLSAGGGGSNERAILGLAWSADGKRLAVANQDSPRIQLWDLPEGKQGKQLSPPDLKGDSRQTIFSLAFLPEGKLLASAGADRAIRLWDLESAKESKQIGGIEYSVIPDDGKEIKREKKSGGSTQALYSLAISGDGRHLAAAGLERVIRVWEISSGNLVATLPGHSRFVTGLAFSPDSKRLASCDHGGDLRLWDLAATKSSFAARIPASAQSLAYSPDGALLAVAGGDSKVHLVSLPS